MTRLLALLACASLLSPAVPPGDTRTAETAIPAAVPGTSEREPSRPSGAPAPSPAASAVPGPRPTNAPSANVSAPAHLSGMASTYGPGWNGWIALPQGPGHTVRVCGRGGCLTVTSNDAGPSLARQREGRVIDLDVRAFEKVCGARWTIGLCPVTVTAVP